MRIAGRLLPCSPRRPRSALSSASPPLLASQPLPCSDRFNPSVRGPDQKGMLVCKISGDVRQVRNMVTKLRQIPSLGPLVQFNEPDIPQDYLCKPAPQFYLEYTEEVAIISGPYKLAVEPLEHAVAALRATWQVAAEHWGEIVEPEDERPADAVGGGPAGGHIMNCKQQRPFRRVLSAASLMDCAFGRSSYQGRARRRPVALTHH